jgi:hypothetical protein
MTLPYCVDNNIDLVEHSLKLKPKPKREAYIDPDGGKKTRTTRDGKERIKRRYIAHVEVYLGGHSGENSLNVVF